ncbi:AAA family ATPase [Kineococcus sp. R86509]|uniref:AAA family ATPase n=1 Tax=Kineococcus sp. R86509 TaxID=3093851 RepID=UPI0036D41F9E
MLEQAGNGGDVAIDNGRGHIRQLWVSNFRSLGDNVHVRLTPLTALVGINGSGKSNILDALRFVRDALTDGLDVAVARRLGIERLRRVATYSRPRNLSVDVEVVVDGQSSTYGFSLAASTGGTYRVAREYLSQWDAAGVETPIFEVSKGRAVRVPAGLDPAVVADELIMPSISAHQQVRGVIDALRQVRVHSIFPRELASPQPVGKTPPMDDNGSNWAAVIRSLSAERHDQLVSALSRVLPDVVDLKVVTSGGFDTVEFVHEVAPGRLRRFNAAQESDGTLRIASLLTALLQNDRPSLIGVEEPELTINPGLLPLLMDFLREAAMSTPVVVTSHSPELLDLVEADEVRVVERHDLVTSVSALGLGEQDLIRRQLLGPGGLLRAGGLRGSSPAGVAIDDLDDVVVIGPPA